MSSFQLPLPDTSTAFWCKYDKAATRKYSSQGAGEN